MILPDYEGLGGRVMQLDPKPATVAERLPASAAARSDAEKHSIRLRSLRSLRHISQFTLKRSEG